MKDNTRLLVSILHEICAAVGLLVALSIGSFVCSYFEFKHPALLLVWGVGGIFIGMILLNAFQNASLLKKK